MTACLSDLRLDELSTGELAGASAAAATEHLAGCAPCRARAQTLAGDRARFGAAPAMPGRRRAAWPAAMIGIAAAAALVLVVRLPRESTGGTRSKGGAHLGFAVAHGGAMRLGAAGEVVHPGDTLSYLVTTDAPAYVTVLGRDAAGRVTTYVATARVAAGRDVELPVATVLDGSLGREDIVAVFCRDAVPVASLAVSPDAPPAGCTLDRLPIEKAP